MADLEEALVLLAAADRDLSALRGMADPLVFADEIAGFHAQQAAEKFLKAWLVLRGEPYPYTHNLARLLKLLQEKEPTAGKFRELNEYTAYAVQLRYEVFEDEAAPIDRQEAVRRLEALRREVRRRLPDAEGS